MEPKICPFISINQPANQSCVCDRCALWIKNPGCEGCALAVLAEGMKEAASDLFDIAANMS